PAAGSSTRCSSPMPACPQLTSSAVRAGAGPWPTRRSPSSAPCPGAGARPRPQGRARSPATSTGPPARSSLPPAPTPRRSPGRPPRPPGRVCVAPGAHAPSVASRPGDSQRLAALAREAGRTSNPAVRQGLARLYTLERLLALTSRRARALQESGGELPGLPNLAKMAQNHAIRLGRDLTFAVLQAAGMLHGYDPPAVAGPPAEHGDGALRGPW